MKDELILNNLNLIWKVIKDLHIQYRTKEELEDYYSIGLIGLVKAVKTYDKDKKSTYLYNGIKNSLLTHFMIKTRFKRKDNIEWYQDIDIEALAVDDEFENRIINKVYIEWLLSKMKNKKNREVIRQFYGIGCVPKNEYQLGEEWNVSHQMINARRRNGLKELRKIIEERNEREIKKAKS